MSRFSRKCFTAFLTLVSSQLLHAQQAEVLTDRANLAIVAAISTSSRIEGRSPGTLNDGVAPTAATFRGGGNSNRQPRTNQWVQYEWSRPISVSEIGLYFWNFNDGIRLPQGFRILFWDGNEFQTVSGLRGDGIGNKRLKNISFDEVKTSRLRLELDSADRGLASLLEWIVYKTDNSQEPPPLVKAGDDRDVMLGGKTYLSGSVKSVSPVKSIKWAKKSGPGQVTFQTENAASGIAMFSTPGNYVISLQADANGEITSSDIKVKVHEPPKAKRLDVVYTKRYKIDSKLWSDRARAMIVNWIPFCIGQINRTDIDTGSGGIDNFLEAAKALRGEPHRRHKGYVFSNAWVHQTVESMCIALMIDPNGDKAMVAAQEKMKKTLEDWIPKILAAQEPDGYLHTAFTLRDTTRWRERWSPRNRGDHEGYVAGYFIESAINHYTLTNGKDRRLYDAAKRLSDCWVNNIGTGKKEWYDGHQEMEQALVRFGRFVNDVEGKKSHGDSYIALAKFLLDSRKNGSEYDQSHVPVQQQYEAVGHAVRATYNYSAMADVAAETGDIDYQSAVMSLWNNMVNKKYYLTGGIGSGETSEGFGGNYSLRNNAYCESCSSAGLIFFQYKMNLAYHDAKYADLYEETMYNALLGSMDLEGKHFYYTNALSSSQARYQWHGCPCCVGNIPRTLLMIPTWAYVRGDNGLFVNMYIGSTIKVEKVAGTNVEMVQKTDYPWSGNIALTLNPEQPKKFSLYLRIPNRTTSELYTPVPQVAGVKSLSVNGQLVPAKIVNGYAVITRQWKKGDRIQLELPMEIQRITADERIEANRGRVALRYGPLVYNVESMDRQDIKKSISDKPLTLEWRPDMLNGIMTIKGTWSDGSPLLAIPNYVRLNRVSPTRYPQSATVTIPREPNEPPQPVSNRDPISIIWIKQ